MPGMLGLPMPIMPGFFMARAFSWCCYNTFASRLMLFHTHRPRRPLSDFVEIIWLNECPAPAHAMERILPSGEMGLIVSLREDTRRYPAAILCGAYSESMVMETAQQIATLGVQFKPGGALPFLRMPAGELQSTEVSLEALWGSEAGFLRERILSARTPQARMLVAEAALLERCRSFSPNAAVAFAVREFEALRSVSSVTGELGISSRRSIEIFRREVGLTPKLFCRVRRFQRILRSVHSRARVDWVEIALRLGYFDQAHFIHDFRTFSGLSPTTYLAHSRRYQNHVPILD